MIVTVADGKDVEVPVAVVAPQENLTKQEKFVKENELLKQKLDKAMRDLATERETKKTEKTKGTDDNKSSELQNRENEFFIYLFFSIIMNSHQK